MKKILALLMTFILIIGLAGCGSAGMGGNDETELDVFMMNPDMYMESLLSSYSGEDGRVTTNVEMGMTNPDMEVGDVLKLLNTRLMNDDGPDIIVMDDINADGYIESGQLTDLSGIISESEDLIKPLTEQDNEMYYVPLSFDVIADSKRTGTSVSFEDMEKYISSLKASGLKSGNFENTVVIWYKTEIEPIIREKNNLGREELAGFYEKVKELMSVTEWYGRTPARASLYPGTFMVNPLNEYWDIYADKIGAARSYIKGISDFQQLYHAKNEGKLEFSYGKAGGRTAYIPTCIIAVNNSSKNKEAALEMVKYMLSEEGQRDVAQNGGYLPVNEKVLRDELENWGEVNANINGVGAILKPLAETEIDEIMKAIENLEYEIYSDSYLMEIILTGAADYGNGDETLDSAVEKAMNKLNIYLTE